MPRDQGCEIADEYRTLTNAVLRTTTQLLVSQFVPAALQSVDFIQYVRPGIWAVLDCLLAVQAVTFAFSLCSRLRRETTARSSCYERLLARSSPAGPHAPQGASSTDLLSGRAVPFLLSVPWVVIFVNALGRALTL